MSYNRSVFDSHLNISNYARIFLGHPQFEIQSEDGREILEKTIVNVDRLFEAAKKYGIRLNLSLKHFRYITPTRRFSAVTAT